MALLGVRRRLVDMRVEIDGQIRGILKIFGLVAGRGNTKAFAQRARQVNRGTRSCRRQGRNSGQENSLLFALIPHYGVS